MSENWSDKLRRIAEKGAGDLGQLCRAVKIDLFSGVVDDTRVDTGRLAGNWQIQDDAPAVGVLDRLDPGKQGVTAEIAAGATPNGLTFFVNNLPYAGVWETEDGMITRNVARVRQIVEARADELRS